MRLPLWTGGRKGLPIHCERNSRLRLLTFLVQNKASRAAEARKEEVTYYREDYCFFLTQLYFTQLWRPCCHVLCQEWRQPLKKSTRKIQACEDHHMSVCICCGHYSKQKYTVGRKKRWNLTKSTFKWLTLQPHHNTLFRDSCMEIYKLFFSFF